MNFGIKKLETSLSYGVQSYFDILNHLGVVHECDAPCGAGAPSPFPLGPCPFTSSSFDFYFSLSFIGFTYFLLLSIPSLSTRIVPLRFQAGGRSK